MIGDYWHRGKGGCYEWETNCLKNYSKCRLLYSSCNSMVCSKFDSGSHVLSAVG
jgi:hypothetical protein